MSLLKHAKYEKMKVNSSSGILETIYHNGSYLMLFVNNFSFPELNAPSFKRCSIDHNGFCRFQKFDEIWNLMIFRSNNEYTSS